MLRGTPDAGVLRWVPVTQNYQGKGEIMFGGPPEGYVPSDAETDMAQRCVASPVQRQHALYAFKRRPEVIAVFVPIVFPRKERGVWTVGQVVVHPEGVGFATDRRESWRIARDHAEWVADQVLGLLPGVVGWVVFERDGSEAVFEGLRLATL